MRGPENSPSGLSESEAAAWAKVAATVDPLDPAPPRPESSSGSNRRLVEGGPPPVPPPVPPPPAFPPATPLRRRSEPQPPLTAEDRPVASRGLDSHWERRLRAGALAPDFTLDLHEHTLDAAYQRLLHGLDLARESGARVVLVIAGRERPAPAADRAGQRGAIRAKLLDWLAASRHSAAIAAIRKAHRRHGGEGALYVILARPR